MRESNHSFPAHGRACICVSSGIYDRRALDAPTASLPLINSLTHLSYLTATSPRVREILAGDGGLERLVSILQQCAQGGAAAAAGSPLRLSGSLDRKGKGKAVDRPRPRRSPFKPFAEYSALPSVADIQVFEELGLPIGSTAPTTSYVDQPMPFTLPPSLGLPLPNKQRFLLHTYTLAFQCIVNIGVRGSEAIRTRVVEAGALDVVVYVLERYLEDVERRRAEASAEWQRQREITAAGAAYSAGEDAMMDVEDDSLVPTFAIPSSAAAAAAATPTLSLPPSTASLPLLTRVNVVAASSSSSSISPGLQPPSRVQTPDTVLSMDDSSVTGDENGSASGADLEGDEVSMPSSSGSSSASTVAAPVPRSALAERKAALASVEAGSDVEMRDQSRPQSPAVASSAQPVRRHARQALPRVRTENTGPASSSLSEPRAEFAASSAGSSPVSYNAAAGAEPVRPASDASSGPLRFRDEDVLLSLQLLAYLSKYPHVRAIFHSSAVASLPLPPAHPSRTGSTSPQAMNVFSLVEAFTFKPASDDPFTPRHSSEVQYWAGVIMRNACRKDDARGGIRQCANMRCVKWEQYAREFAKCRRCRRAKYCSKVCQSEAWTQGHRYWCHKVASRRSDSGDVLSRSSAAADAHGSSAASTPTGISSGSEGLATPRAGEAAPSRRRHHSHQHHHSHHHAPSHGHGHAHQSARRRHRNADEEEDDEDDLPVPPTIAVHDASTTPRAHPQRLPGGAPQFDLGPAEIGPTQTGLVPGVDEDHIAREMLRAASGAGIGIGLGDNFDGVVRVQTT